MQGRIPYYRTKIQSRYVKCMSCPKLHTESNGWVRIGQTCLPSVPCAGCGQLTEVHPKHLAALSALPV